MDTRLCKKCKEELVEVKDRVGYGIISLLCPACLKEEVVNSLTGVNVYHPPEKNNDPPRRSPYKIMCGECPAEMLETTASNDQAGEFHCPNCQRRLVVNPLFHRCPVCGEIADAHTRPYSSFKRSTTPAGRDTGVAPYLFCCFNCGIGWQYRQIEFPPLLPLIPYHGGPTARAMAYGIDDA